MSEVCSVYNIYPYTYVHLSVLISHVIAQCTVMDRLKLTAGLGFRCKILWNLANNTDKNNQPAKPPHLGRCAISSHPNSVYICK
jgi:hypothetical protein